jgi:hypothetical protein
VVVENGDITEMRPHRRHGESRELTISEDVMHGGGGARPWQIDLARSLVHSLKLYLMKYRRSSDCHAMGRCAKV